MTLDLTGLPPTDGEITALLNDDAPDAYEQAVDRLLGSQRYGERMGPSSGLMRHGTLIPTGTRRMGNGRCGGGVIG
ncbi:MAG: hypothetical protein Ct9H300mP25_10320 [Acidobacteriota bacterium]|nr:MAG: hypothetical protein Ct9H300mP25_10320 [Acidobacteriota bacterium]